MGRIISKTRTYKTSGYGNRGWSSRHDYGHSYGSGFSWGRRSWIGLVVVGVIIAIGAGFIFWGSKKADENARKESPQAVTAAFMQDLSTGNEGAAMNFVEEGDAAATAEVEGLFEKYSGQTMGEDYINWTGLSYGVENISDTEVSVLVSGIAELIEVEVETGYDSYGDEYEDRTETLEDTVEFKDKEFKLKKSNEEWFVSEVPDTIF